MKIEVGGKVYTGFVAANAQLRLDAFSNSFGFEATARRDTPLPFTGGEACRILVDGELVLTGFIELVNVDYAPDNHSISIQGRDKTGDLVDSMIGNDAREGGLSDLQAPISIARVVRTVIGHLGLDIKVFDEALPALFRESEDVMSPEPGDNVFEFLQKWSRKRQVLLSSTPSGDVLITSGSGRETRAYIHHEVGSAKNNVLSSSYSYDSTGRFNVYRSIGQMNMVPRASTGGDVSDDAIVGQGANVSDINIRKGRQFILVSEALGSASDGKDRVAWERNIRRARGKVYGAQVNGYRNNLGDLWKVGDIIQVKDAYVNTPSRMIINSVTFSLDLERGRRTDLGLMQKDAYQLELEEPTEAEDSFGF